MSDRSEGSREPARLAGWLRERLAHPLAQGLDLDSPEATEAHARLIREKPFLRRLYASYCAAYDAAIARATSGGLVVEIGSGGRFYRSLRPNVLSLDLRRGAEVVKRQSETPESAQARVVVEHLHSRFRVGTLLILTARM